MSYEEFMIAKTLSSIPTEQIYEALSQFDKDGKLLVLKSRRIIYYLRATIRSRAWSTCTTYE